MMVEYVRCQVLSLPFYTYLLCYENLTIISILQIRKPKLQEIKYLTQKFKPINFPLSVNARGYITYRDTSVILSLRSCIFFLSFPLN